MTVPGEFGGDPVDVLVRRDPDADFEPLGRWTVQRTMAGGALVPPDDALADVGRWFGGTSVVDLLVDDGGSRQVHRFRVAGLAEALASLGCWGGRTG